MKSLSNKYKQRNEDFMEDLQQQLLANQKKYLCGIDQFQKIYKRKKLISQTIDDYRRDNQYAKQNIIKAKQRLYQIEQLNDKAIKQTVLMKNQMDKINQVHMLSKILMIQKMIKQQKQEEDLQHKRNNNFRIRAQKNKAQLNTLLHRNSKSQKVRHLSMIQSKATKDCLQQLQYQKEQQNRKKADMIREGTRRKQNRLKRYEQFKLDRARKNYLDKTQMIKQQVAYKIKQFEDIFGKEQQQEQYYETTQKVTKQYLNSLFATETI